MPETTVAAVPGWPFKADSPEGDPAYTARDARQLVTATALPALPVRPLGTASGVRPGTGTVVWVAGGTVTVGAHSGVVDAGPSAATGPYSYAVTDTVSWTLDAPHATYPRVDLVGVRVDDDDEGDGTGQRRAVVAYLPGNPAVSPAVPATPDRWMPLARVQVPASGTGSPAVSEVWDALPSPVWSVRTPADLPALAARLAGSQTPALAHVASTGALMQLRSGTWALLPTGLDAATASFAPISYWLGTGKAVRASGRWQISLMLTQANPGGISAAWTTMGSVASAALNPGQPVNVVYGHAMVGSPNAPSVASINLTTGLVQMLMPAFTGTTSTTYYLALTWPAA